MYLATETLRRNNLEMLEQKSLQNNIKNVFNIIGLIKLKLSLFSTLKKFKLNFNN